jgi:hypothetical protein
VARPLGDRGPRALNGLPAPTWRLTRRSAAAAVGCIAFLALHHVAVETGSALRAAADEVAVLDAAGYLTAVAPPRPGRPSPDPRLLSAATGLLASSFWTGELQVWLNDTPLLPGDTARAAHPNAPLPGVEGVARGVVAAWGTVPDVGTGTIDLWTGLLLVILAGAVGRLIPAGRARRLLLVLVLAGLGLAVTDRVRSVARSERAATDQGLLRARRMLESTAAGRRLPEATILSMTGGRAVLVVKDTLVRREAAVTRDSLGASVLVTGARRQRWRLVAPRTELGGTWALLFLLGAVTMAGAGLAGALPPGAGYLTTSPRTPPTDP